MGALVKSIFSSTMSVAACQSKGPVISMRPGPSGKLAVFAAGAYHLLSHDAIIHCKAYGNYARIFLRDGSSYCVAKTLKALQAELPENQFTRCHQSHLINNIYIQSISQTKATLVNGESRINIPIARRKLTTLKKRLGLCRKIPTTIQKKV